MLLPILLAPLLTLPAAEKPEHVDYQGQSLRWSPAEAAVSRDRLTIWSRGREGQPSARMEVRRTVSFRVTHGDAQAIAHLLGLTGLRPGPVRGTWIAEAATPVDAVAAATRLRQVPQVAWAAPVVAHRLVPRVVPNDPLLASEWHLGNGLLDCSSAWADGWTGAGTTITIIDTLFDENHPDLTPAYNLTEAYDALTPDIAFRSSPWTTNTAVDHATFCAGLAAARGNNGLGMSGVAWNAALIPIRLIPATRTDPLPADSDEGEAIAHAATTTDVVNCSWGPDDDGITIAEPGPLALASLDTLVTSGRGGKGAVITWAAGNGHPADNLSFDGYASNRRVMAIGAITKNGTHANYSEGGPALLAVAPGGDTSSTGGLVGTLIGSRYTTAGDGFAGTSFAAPIAAGVVALMLEARPALTWRDVRRLVATTAIPPEPALAAWQTTSGGHPWHPLYGFGRVDAWAAVQAAKTATLLPAEATPVSGSWTGPVTIPDNQPTTGASVELQWSITAANDYRIEWVECALDVSHPAQGDLDLTIIAPSGRTALFAGRSLDTYAAIPWTYTAVGFLDEDPNGTWRATIRDKRATRTGQVQHATLTIRGYRTGGATSNGQTSGSTGQGAVVGTIVTTPSGSSVSGGGGGGSGCGSGSGLAAAAALLALVRLRRSATARRP